MPLEDDLRAFALDVATRASETMADALRANAPVDTGSLLDSIELAPAEDSLSFGGVLRASAPHAASQDAEGRNAGWWSDVVNEETWDEHLLVASEERR